MGPRADREHVHDVLGRLPHRRAVERATSSCATRASTATRSTGAGCATRAASASRRSTPPTACAAPLRPRRRRARRHVVERGARRGRRSGRPGALERRRPEAVAVLGGARRHQRGRLRLGQAGQGASSAPPTSTPSSATACRPAVLGLPRATIDEACRGVARSCCSGRTSRRSSGPVPAPARRGRAARGCGSSSFARRAAACRATRGARAVRAGRAGGRGADASRWPTRP